MCSIPTRYIPRMTAFNSLLNNIRACTICEPFLPDGVRPIVQAHPTARILIAGQAPGRKVHETGIPFDDPSGNRLRDWMGISRETFYDASKIAIVPMGFCFPGTGKSGDLPPRTECAPEWRSDVLGHLSQVQITLVVGAYAQAYHLENSHDRLTDAVKDWRAQFPSVIPLPHPSPRNNRWLVRNPWFEAELIPVLRSQVASVLTV